MRSVWMFVLALLAVLLTACSQFPSEITATVPAVTRYVITVTPVASATSAQTGVFAPSETATIPCTPDVTPSPVPPTSHPSLSGAVPIPEVLPEIPIPLYFLREGAIWMWPAEGGALQPVVVPAESGQIRSGFKRARLDAGAKPGPTGVLAYRLTPDGRYLAYAIDGQPDFNGIIVLDQQTGETFSIPATHYALRGAAVWLPGFDLTPDGHFLVYAGWGLLPSGEDEQTLTGSLARFSTIFAVDVRNPNLEYELGYCAQRVGNGASLGCAGFILSPDGTHLAFSDGRGLWLTDIPEGNPRLLMAHRFPEEFCGVFQVLHWSPDGRYLLIRVGCYEGAYLAVVDVATAEFRQVPDSFSYQDEHVEAVWARDPRLLYTFFSLGTSSGIARLDPSRPDEPEMYVFWESGMMPTAPRGLSDGRTLFFNQSCEPDAAYSAGVYVLDADGSGLAQMAAIPAIPCDIKKLGLPSLERILWSTDGFAAAYLLSSTGDEPNALLLGYSDGGARWDVCELLSGASGFQWQPPYAGYWR